MPDNRTPEQERASENLESALIQACKAYGHLEEGWALGDYLICLEYSPFDPMQVGREKYGYILPSDYMPTHRIKGLLHQMISVVEPGGDE